MPALASHLFFPSCRQCNAHSDIFKQLRISHRWIPAQDSAVCYTRARRRQRNNGTTLVSAPPARREEASRPVASDSWALKCSHEGSAALSRGRFVIQTWRKSSYETQTELSSTVKDETPRSGCRTGTAAHPHANSLRARTTLLFLFLNAAACRAQPLPTLQPSPAQHRARRLRAHTAAARGNRACTEVSGGTGTHGHTWARIHTHYTHIHTHTNPPAPLSPTVPRRRPARHPPPGLGSLPRSARAPGASATMATSSSGGSSTVAEARRGEPGAERGPAG